MTNEMEEEEGEMVKWRDTMDKKGRENDNEMEDEEGEMVKWRDTMDTMDKIETKKGREIERETDWELTQSGETPVLIRVGRSAASGHCVGGGSDDWR